MSLEYWLTRKASARHYIRRKWSRDPPHTQGPASWRPCDTWCTYIDLIGRQSYQSYHTRPLSDFLNSIQTIRGVSINHYTTCHNMLCCQFIYFTFLLNNIMLTLSKALTSSNALLKSTIIHSIKLYIPVNLGWSLMIYKHFFTHSCSLTV